MRILLVLGLGLFGCGADGGSTGDDTGGEPTAVVQIDGEGTVMVKDQRGAQLAGSPFACGGGNCSNDVVTTTSSITFTPAPAATFKLSRATIERGGDNVQMPVTATAVIPVDSSIGWVLHVTFDPI